MNDALPDRTVTSQDHAEKLDRIDQELRWVREASAEYGAEVPARLLLLHGQLLCWRAELLVTTAGLPGETGPAESLAAADLREARPLLRRAAEEIPVTTTADDENPGLTARLVLGECCAGLYQLDGVTADAEEAIERFREVVPHLVQVEPFAGAEAAWQLAELLFDRARAEPDHAAWLPRLSEATELLGLVVKFGQDDPGLCADARVSRALIAEYRLACEQVTGLEEAAARAEFCSLLAETVREVPAEHPERWRVDWAFAEHSHLEYLDSYDPDVLERALRHWELALAGARLAGEPPAEVLGGFASTLASHWHHTDSRVSRDRAIALYEEATACRQQPDPMEMLECGLLLADRYSSRNPDPDAPDPEALADLDHAIGLAAMAAAAGQSDLELAEQAGLLRVQTLTEKLRYLEGDPGLVEHVGQAIRITEPLLARWTGDRQDRLELVGALGYQRLRRFYLTMDEHDLRTGIELLTQVYDETTPDDPDRTRHGLLLAMALNTGDRCGLISEDQALEAARLAEEYGAQATTSGDPVHLVRLKDQLMRAGLRQNVDWQAVADAFKVPAEGAPGRRTRLTEAAPLALIYRAFYTGSARDGREAVSYLREQRATSEPGSEPYRDVTVYLGLALVLGARQGWAPPRMRPIDAVDEAVALVTEVLPTLTLADRLRGTAEFVLSLAELIGLSQRPVGGVEMREFATMMARLLGAIQRYAQQMPGQIGAIGERIHRVGTALARYGHARTAADVEDIVTEFRAVLATPADDGYINVYRFGLGRALTKLYDYTRDPSCLTEAIEHLRDALASVSFEPALHKDLTEVVAESLRKLADHAVDPNGRYHEESRAAAIELLRGYGKLAVLQSTAADAAALVQEAGARTATAVSWCVADGAWGDAVTALEAGRALTLNAALTWASVTERLRLAGRADLAEEWEREGPAVAPGQAGGGMPQWFASALLPSDLPARVLTVLGEGLVEPPDSVAIGKALTRLERDALVYLVPGDARQPGHAVVVDAHGRVTGARLPDLVDCPGGVLDHYHGTHDALRAAGTGEDRGSLRASWTAALDELTAWAWSAAMEWVLTAVPAVALPRLVIVPVGRLSGVPWHAAHSRVHDPATARPRYALGRAVISYTASARLLLDCAARPAMPVDGTALIVGNPTGDDKLDWAELEATALWRTFYPQAAYFGLVADLGDGVEPDRTLRECTPGDLLAGLPGGTRPRPVVHLSCHAGLPPGAQPGSVLGARLKLGPGGLALSVAKVLHQAAGRLPDSPGPLVDLAGCGTHLTGEQHDEALTLSTAFLAAGASTVLGSLWRVMDRRTALLMFVVHHHMRVGGLPVAEALRRAQLWMLDPARQPVPDMPPAFTDAVHDEKLAEPRGWAAFVHQGR